MRLSSEKKKRLHHHRRNDLSFMRHAVSSRKKNVQKIKKSGVELFSLLGEPGIGWVVLLLVLFIELLICDFFSTRIHLSFIKIGWMTKCKSPNRIDFYVGVWKTACRFAQKMEVCSRVRACVCACVCFDSWDKCDDHHYYYYDDVWRYLRVVREQSAKTSASQKAPSLTLVFFFSGGAGQMAKTARV